MSKPIKRTIIHLGKEYTQVEMSESERNLAIIAAHWRTASPHEWAWSPDQQARMALYVLWAAQRLEAIENLSTGAPLKHDSTPTDQSKQR